MRIVGDFLGNGDEPTREQSDIETQVSGISVGDLFFGREKIEEQRSHSGIAQNFRDSLIARTTPAASATMREKHQTACVSRNLQIADEHDFSARNPQCDGLRRKFRFLAG